MTGPDGKVPWRLPSYIWLDHWRRAWLEAAEHAFREGYEEGFQENLERSVILRLFFWRSIDVPESVRRKLRESKDLAELQTWRQLAYDVTDPADLFLTE